MARFLSLILLSLIVGLLVSSQVQADRPFVPGSGDRVATVGDDFEDARWGYIKNGRKASYEDDEKQRPPGGKSRNGRWYESALRGQPDLIKRVTTPPDGLAWQRKRHASRNQILRHPRKTGRQANARRPVDGRQKPSRSRGPRELES